MVLHTKYQGSMPCGFRQVFLTQRALFEQTWFRPPWCCYIPNINALGLVVLDKKIFFYVFPI